MNAEHLDSALLAGAGGMDSPAYIVDEGLILERLELLKRAAERCGVRRLFSVKSLPVASLIRSLGPRLDGLSVSSWFEARLCAEFCPDRPLHLTTPGLRPDEFASLAGLCRYISLNSLNQWRRWGVPREGLQLGLRVNPGLSFLADPRCDPCRPESKLGVPLGRLAEALDGGDLDFQALSGLHFHSQFESMSFEPLARTIEHLAAALPQLLARLAWINLGGGYLFHRQSDLDGLCRAVEGLRRRCPGEVFFEPGKALVGDAGCLRSTVIDLFQADTLPVAVLDSSVNHLPEVFEYQRSPRVAEAVPGAGWRCVLAGASCLSGDRFGEYEFPQPLRLGDTITFVAVGAYALPRSHRFNGINLPSIYLRNGTDIRRLRRYDYADFRSQWMDGPASADPPPLTVQGSDTQSDILARGS